MGQFSRGARAGPTALWGEYVILSGAGARIERMTETKPILTLAATLRLSTLDAKRTAGRFNELIADNRTVFRQHFGVDLFPGSLNLDVAAPASLQRDLDAGSPPPAFVIPKRKLINMPGYIGDGQSWPCLLFGEKFPVPVQCWIFRRIRSRVPLGVIEIVATTKLRDAYSLQHGDAVTIEILSSDESKDELSDHRMCHGRD